jgi:hypothetical protein
MADVQIFQADAKLGLVTMEITPFSCDNTALVQ